MATQAGTNPQANDDPHAPEIWDYLLAVGAAILLAAMVTAIARGANEWHLLRWPMWVHIATLAAALTLTPLMLLRSRGDMLHRRLGQLWLSCMLVTALVSFLIPPLGNISPIWILSVLTLIGSYQIWNTAKAHQWRKHRRHVRNLVTAGLLIAGFFTFQFGRIFDRWISGIGIG